MRRRVEEEKRGGRVHGRRVAGHHNVLELEQRQRNYELLQSLLMQVLLKV